VLERLLFIEFTHVSDCAYNDAINFPGDGVREPIDFKNMEVIPIFIEGCTKLIVLVLSTRTVVEVGAHSRLRPFLNKVARDHLDIDLLPVSVGLVGALEIGEESATSATLAGHLHRGSEFTISPRVPGLDFSGVVHPSVSQ